MASILARSSSEHQISAFSGLVRSSEVFVLISTTTMAVYYCRCNAFMNILIGLGEAIGGLEDADACQLGFACPRRRRNIICRGCQARLGSWDVYARLSVLPESMELWNRANEEDEEEGGGGGGGDGGGGGGKKRRRDDDDDDDDDDGNEGKKLWLALGRTLRYCD